MNNQEIEKRIESIEKLVVKLSESYATTTQVLCSLSPDITKEQKERIITSSNGVLSLISLLRKSSRHSETP